MFIAIPGFEGLYTISREGEVRSLERLVIYKDGRKKLMPEAPMKPSYDNDHYISFRFVDRNGKKSKKYLHSLLALVFIGPRPDGYHVCHNDGNKLNNSICNLRYDTRSGNMIDKVKHGTALFGPKNHITKLKTEEVKKIRQKYADGEGQLKLSETFGVSQSTISSIVNRTTWGWLSQEEK